MITVKFHLGDIPGNVNKAAKRTLPALTTQVYTDTDPYVPFLTGDLSKSANRAADFERGIIHYNQPYARRLYYNPQYNFTKTFHPQARGRWFDYSKTQNKGKWVQTAQSGMVKYYGRS
ncbi:MAG: minor capsid protein [Sporolactobacillus sp.]